MITQQAIIDEIRGVLLSGSGLRTGRDEPLAREYARACAEVNTRLANCQSLLKRGLRDEAIHAAKQAPDLVDGVESLFFFQGRADWLDRVAMYELPPSQGLDEEAFGTLQEAFADSAPLQAPLRKHRRLALARAPLGERIGVLRQLATLDPANPVWPEDIATFEAARIEQVRHELARAKASGDATALRRLCDELSDPRWTIAVPPNVSSEAAGC